MKVNFRSRERLAPAGWTAPRIRVDSKHPPADTFDVGLARVVSPKLAAVIVDAIPSSDYELLPIDLSYKGRPVVGYSILHVLRRIDALDRAKSKFTLDEDTIDSVERVAIDSAKVAHPLFELDAFAWVVCVSDDVASRVESTGCSGVVFETPEQWRPF